MTEKTIDSETSPVETEHQIQFLGFCVGDEEYGIDIHRVQEIRGWEPVTRIPNAPAYEKGVINLRGSIIPIIDLREKFGSSRVEYTPTTVVIVLQVGPRIIGVVVDSVSNVINVDKRSIQKKPEVGVQMNLEYISGLILANNRMVVLLNIDTLLKLDTADSHITPSISNTTES
jgi:purine-binding chemotaxis protein CheW